MKNKVIKVISLFLAVIICLMTSISAFAESETKINRTCPKIFVNGFMASVVYEDPSDPDSDTAWPPSQDRILNTVKNAIGPIAKLAIDGNWDSFSDSLVPIIDELFAPACSDFNGDVSNGSGIRFEYPERETITQDSSVEFCYDWRMDPILIASQLNDYVNYILDCSGSDEVVIECHSLGGVITSTYFKLYGSEKVRSVVLNSTAIYGETYTGELFKGEIKLNDSALKHFLDYTFDDTEYEELLSFVFGMLYEAGVLDFVCDFAEKMVSEIYDKAMFSVMKLFANWPTIWAMVPDEDLAEAETYAFGMYEEKGVDFDGLKEKVTNYNTKIRAYKTETLKNLSKTTNVYVIGRYGYCSIPITPSWNALGDGVIDTKYNSLGATTANFGEKLDVEISEYVSSDKTVDASTCLFPEQTWFIRNIKHSDMPSCLNTLVDTLLYHDGLADVNTYDEYPRFLEYDAENGKLVIDKDLEEVTFLEKIKLIIFKIIEAIKSIFSAV